ncbi:FG-GAP-like repeat-containing protein [Cohnella abietis]|uniref:SLH domain-containing protein n=1 Tax=Cohnella abietis TaxID=2507935 RepID=A0A3T1CYM1_9BACL|nr:FG-GAP-like repeat-containing protein [Cohnella abietis]BBI30845.1 hypothetical protein KCTCHS21_02440 [Cohnella abietis]
MKSLIRQKSLFIKVALVIVLLFTIQKPFQTYAAPFKSATSYSAGTSTTDVTSADFNKDGHLDVASASLSSSSISVLLGNGDGTFGSEVTYNAGGQAIAITNADFNGDGHIDLATANWSSHSVSILLGNGDGTFANALVIPMSNSVHFIATADFNTDGKMDLALTYSGGSRVDIMLGKGDGTFEPSVSFGTGNATYQVTIGDFNADDKPDLAIASYTDRKVSVLLGNGDGTFAPKVDYTTGQYTQRVVTGDLNKDGKLDLVASNSSGSISILLGNGDGTFQNSVNYLTKGADSRAILIGDFVGDEEVDILVANYGSSSTLSIFSGHGDGTFEPAKTYNTGIGAIFNSVSGDFNGDGVLDVALVSQGGNYVYILLGNHRNADLQSLSLSGGANLNTPFNTDTLGYTSSVAYNVYSINLKPTLVDTTATVTAQVYGGGAPEAIASGGTSSELPLNVGINTIDVVVTAQDGTTVKTYTVDVTRRPNTDASLSGLSLSGGATLSQSFSSGTLSYTSNVAYSQSSVRVTPVGDATATVTVKVNGGTPEVIASGSTSSELPLNVGVNTIDVVVTAQDGTTIKTYTVDVTRANYTGVVTPTRSTNANLNGLSLTGGAALTPTFTLGTFSYTSSVTNDIGSVGVTPTLADTKATVKLRVNGSTPIAVTSGGTSGTLPLNVGTNVIDVTVTAEDGTSQSYTITLTRQAASGAELQPKCTFTDIQQHWAKAEICEAADLGIVEGVNANTFAPDRTVTRAEFAVMLLRALQIPISEQSGTLPFSDKESIPSWAASTIHIGVAEGMLEGYTDGTFRPHQTITRSEMATMIAKSMKWKADSEKYLSYADGTSIPEWARPYVEAVHVSGLLQGRGSNRFVPNGITTRAEAAVVMLRLWTIRN